MVSILRYSAFVRCIAPHAKLCRSTCSPSSPFSQMNVDAGIVSCGLSALTIGPDTDASVDTKSVSWGIATKLGAHETQDGATAHNLCDHRWRWFAGAPREWRRQFEAMVQRRLHRYLWEHWKHNGIPPITEDTPIEDADELLDAREAVSDALWDGNLAELKQRAVDLRSAGEEECRKKCTAPPTNLRLTSRRSTLTCGYPLPD